MIRRTAACITAAIMILILLPTEARAAAAEGSGDIITASFSVVDDAALDAEIGRLISESGRSADSLSVALYYTGTGEYYYYNANRWWYTASLFKLPLVMTISRMQVAGELDNIRLKDTDMESVKEMILRDSNNSWAYGLQRDLFKDDMKFIRSRDLSYSEGFPEEELVPRFHNSYLYSARFYLGIVKELYYNSDDYPNVIKYMCEASPDKYLHGVLGDSYTIAQKYGSADHMCHAGGIIYTPEPVLLVVMNNGVEDVAGNRIIGEIAAYVANCAEEWHLALENGAA